MGRVTRQQDRSGAFPLYPAISRGTPGYPVLQPPASSRADWWRLQLSSAQLWEAAGSQRAEGDAAPSRSACPDRPRETGDRHPLTGTAPVAHPDPSTALPDGSPTAPRRLTGSKAQQHRQHPQRPQLHPGARSRAEPRHTVPNAGMRDPWSSTALLFLGRDPPLCPVQPTEAPPRAPPYSQRGLDLSPNNSDPTPHYNAFSGKIVDQAREANIG